MDNYSIISTYDIHEVTNNIIQVSNYQNFFGVLKIIESIKRNHLRGTCKSIFSELQIQTVDPQSGRRL